MVYAERVTLFTHGVPGKDIACDLHMEHLNRLLKAGISGLGANKTPTAITRLAKCLLTLSEVIDHFDQEHKVKEEANRHSLVRSSKDRDLILQELVKHAAFDIIPKRKHNSFATLSPNLISYVEHKDHLEWMQVQWKRLMAGLL